MTTSLHVFALLSGQTPKALAGSLAIVGPDGFLRQKALSTIVQAMKLDPSSIRNRDGDECTWRDIHDDLATRSLFDEDGHRITVVNAADGFVSKHRAALEQWVEKPASHATLVLDLNSFPGNTKLFKAVQKWGLIVDCATPAVRGVPDDAEIRKWVVGWAKSQHSITLSSKQANLMVERVGAVFGLLDSELAKLALFADNQGRISDDKVREMVGGWRTKTAWDIADDIADGRTAVAMEQLDQLLKSGQNPIGLSAQWSWHFRRFGIAASFIEQAERMGNKLSLGAVLKQAGFYPSKLADADCHKDKDQAERQHGDAIRISHLALDSANGRFRTLSLHDQFFLQFRIF